MLLPDNIRPENSIYYNGAFVLKELQKKPEQKLIHLYESVRKTKNMSFPIFVLCIDWLFLLNVVNLDNEDNVKLCF